MKEISQENWRVGSHYRDKWHFNLSNGNFSQEAYDMGGRGAASGVSVKGITYGNDYKTLLRVDNIKFVQSRKQGSTPVPLETMSAGKNRVYVLINNKDVMKSIALYNKDGIRRRQIDLDHAHGRQQPHTHIGYGASRKIVPLTKSDKAYIKKVMRIWNNQ